MKYIRKFESVEEPEIDDYVICDVNINGYKDLHEFLKTHVGKIINIVRSVEPYHVRYDVDRVDFPDLSSMYHKGKYTGKKLTIAFSPREVKYFAKNKEELEIRQQADIYNL